MFCYSVLVIKNIFVSNISCKCFSNNFVFTKSYILTTKIYSLLPMSLSGNEDCAPWTKNERRTLSVRRGLVITCRSVEPITRFFHDTSSEQYSLWSIEYYIFYDNPLAKYFTRRVYSSGRVKSARLLFGNNTSPKMSLS